jgi:acid phosphatase (class A)
MKKILLMVAAIMMATLNIYAQEETKPVYLTTEELPDLIKCLPAPPAFDSPEFANDMMRYAWGKQQRIDQERAEIAKGDAVWDPIDALFHQFAVPFGLEVTAEDTPEIYKLLTTAIYTTDQMRVAPKAFYHRQRPFERFEDAILTGEEDELRGEGSYPSGHTMRGQMCALLMSQIAPQQTDTLFYRAYIYGQSRVIAGAHWQSDVDASRIGASIGFCALQGSEAFREQMKKAQAEYAEKTSQGTGVRRAVIVEHPASARTYHVDGISANEVSRGALITNSKKVIRK